MFSLVKNISHICFALHHLHDLNSYTLCQNTFDGTKLYSPSADFPPKKSREHFSSSSWRHFFVFVLNISPKLRSNHSFLLPRTDVTERSHYITLSATFNSFLLSYRIFPHFLSPRLYCLFETKPFLAALLQQCRYGASLR